LSKDRKLRLDPITHSAVFSGELIDYRNFDQKHNLPPGTSKNFLRKVAGDFQLEMDWEDEKTIRFKRQFEILI
jgi:hypothetical protein